MAETKEWTVMFYFAGDNPLAALMVSLLKDIKNAGFHEDVNVIAQFDPNALGVPSKTFDINGIRKFVHQQKRHTATAEAPAAASVIGNGDQPDVHIWPVTIDRLWKDKGLEAQVRDDIMRRHPGFVPPVPDTIDDKASVREALDKFLTFCRAHYPAAHYALFLVGHGMIVANDTFMADENPASFLSLKELGGVLGKFNKATGKADDGDSKLEILGFHNCSMSGAEVAYELHGKANYMLGAEGPTFTASWPYRQILIRLFSTLQKNGGADVAELAKGFFNSCYYNSIDYKLAGLSLDVSLCDLRHAKIMQAPVRALAGSLSKFLPKHTIVANLVLLAHWEAQSYWNEMYTDLYDFCECLKTRCEKTLENVDDQVKTVLGVLAAQCQEVMNALASPDGPLIKRALPTGPALQYSRGLSVYFPWSQPLNPLLLNETYAGYAFAKETKWGAFLKTYLTATMRSRRVFQEGGAKIEDIDVAELGAILSFKSSGMLEGDKTNPQSGHGGSCTCPSIKNYPVLELTSGNAQDNTGRHLPDQGIPQKEKGIF